MTQMEIVSGGRDHRPIKQPSWGTDWRDVLHNTPALVTRRGRSRSALALVLIVAVLIPLLATAADAQVDGTQTNNEPLVAGTSDGAQPERAGQPGGQVQAPETPAGEPEASQPEASQPGASQPGDTATQPGASPDDTIDSSDEPIEQAELLHWRRYARATKELVITEVMQNPQVTYDSLGEWFEVYNPYNRSIRLNGWIIGDLGFDQHVIDSDRDLVIESGGYLVLGNNPDTATNGGVELDYSYGQAVQLFNSSDAVILQRPRGAVAARVAWDDGVSFPDPNGESMALRNFWDDDEIASNWCVSTAQYGAGDLGSPGEPNDCTAPASLKITEIMQNPNAVSDSVGEWFEVTNLGSGPVDLAGWTIRDDDVDRHVITASVPLGAGERVVLGRNADRDVNGRVDVDYAYGDDIRLYNSWDEIVLVDPQGRRADRVKWNDGRTFPDPTGSSMSIIDERGESEAGANWCAAGTPFGAGDLGTPGAATVCSGTVVEQGPALTISEVMRNPSAVSDSVGEWFEVHNPNPFAVDLAGWVIRDHDSNFHVITDTVNVSPGGYAVLGRSADNPGPSHAYVYDDVILHNGSDELVLVNPTGAIVDQVVWNNDEFPAEAGASMALSDLALNNDAGESWCASTPDLGNGDLGTPGAANVCDQLPSDATLVISELMANPYNSYDSAGEWFELHNVGPVAVDLKGYTIKDEDFNEFTIDTSLVVDPDGYLVLGRFDDPALNGGVMVDYVYGTEMVLINSGDELVILDTDRKVVDRLVWGTGTDFAIPSGASLQVVDIAADNFAFSAWCEAGISMPGGDAGTPGLPTNCDPEPDDENYLPEYDHKRCSRRNLRAIVGTDGDDLLIGTSGPDVFIGLRGDDRIEGLGGDDLICAGPGNDIIDGGTGNDIILAGSGQDTIDSGAGNDWVFAGRGNDSVLAGSGNDSVSLGPGNDKVDAGSGNDKVTGNRGTDTIDGGSGADICRKATTTYNCES